MTHKMFKQSTKCTIQRVRLLQNKNKLLLLIARSIVNSYNIIAV